MEENPKTYRRSRRRMVKTSHDTPGDHYIPGDIITNILSRLPVKSVLRFRCVCKFWHALVTDPSFIDTHLNQTCANNNGCLLVNRHYGGGKFSLHCAETFVEHMRLELPFESSYPCFSVVDYCNGLLCLSFHGTLQSPCYNRDIYLWNPSSRKFKALPNSKLQGRSYPKFGHIYLAFGFVSQANDYRVVKFNYRKYGRGRSIFSRVHLLKAPPKVEIYSLRLNSWKMVQNVVPCVIDYASKYSIMNGVAHWVARMDTAEDPHYQFILSFDMANEVFGKIQMPECVCDGFARDQSVTVLKELLSLFVQSRERVDIWVMKEYGAAESWTKEFTFDWLVSLFPLGFMKNGEVLLKGYDRELVSYDPRVQQVKDLHIPGILCSLHVFTDYMESLVLLNEGN